MMPPSESRPAAHLSSWLAAALGALAALLCVATLAGAAGAPSRAEYVATLEPICKPGDLASERATEGLHADLRAERLDIAASKFSRAAAIFAGTVHRVAVVPRPPEDLARLAKWFGYLAEEAHYLRKIAAALRAGQTIRSQRYTARFVHNGNLANNTVLAFGFDYCAFEITRFG